MALIKVLDSHTVNQIAAGEVVERPASVVKELMENAFDAGATRIDIHLIEGGKEKIRIVDNGSGMDEEDLTLSVQRYATSKISKASDLLTVHTLGFRGEALPSIASVAKVEITTRQGDEQGRRLRIEGGKIHPVEIVGAPPGTTVDVEDLFYNTPARKKFLKSTSAEASLCAEVVHRLALSHPAVALSLRQGRQVTFRTAGNNRTIEVISSLYGKECLPYLLEVNSTMTETGWQLRGYIGQPALNRSNRNQQNWFVNGRWVRCRALSVAVEEAFQGTLPLHRFPFFVLYLTIPSANLDVNAHPTKQEIKFNREKEVSHFVYKAVASTLNQRSLTRPLWDGPQEKKEPLNENSSTKANNLKKELYEKAIDFHKDIDQSSNNQSFKQDINASFSKPIVFEADLASEKESLQEQKTSWQESRSTLTNLEGEKEVQEKLLAGQIAQWIPIGQFRCRYIIAEGDDGLYLIDQHAAHERVLYQQLKQKVVNLSEEEASQQLLIARSITFTALEFQTLIEEVQILRDMGFVLEHFGGQTFLVRAVPVNLPIGEEEEYLRTFIEKIMKGNRRDRALVQEAALESLACQGAIKAGQRLNYSEMTALLQDLALLEGTDTCPHGRPYLIRIGLKELEGKFHRT
ncbi:DNA mismatch repair endonuclease MutL [Heliorestis acidaminivorans]|uniref:DNA mismatch repair protein MutL n=1 Tax=Heliorestis acidaminivorans TaxID=553427 RepID=A0A6I0F5V1_9FIRM|nr:DNA mismatch repair endonuclease MutL [Heliorestis acidaminivorans]KAB2954207.1 DNA mismatch repair endonuclease MutL [Heliorestis acidaminivorans]